MAGWTHESSCKLRARKIKPSLLDNELVGQGLSKSSDHGEMPWTINREARATSARCWGYGKIEKPLSGNKWPGMYRRGEHQGGFLVLQLPYVLECGG